MDVSTNRLLAVRAQNVDVESALGCVEQWPARSQPTLASSKPIGALPTEPGKAKGAVAAARRANAA